MSSNNENKSTNGTPESAMDINTDENMGGTTHLNDPVSEDTEVEKLQEEVAALKDKYLRLVADFDNLRKRTAKERLELIQTAGKDVIISLLEVLDDCDRAEKQLQQDSDPERLKQGIQLVFLKFRNTLQAKGVKSMNATGQEFNADLHEAITEIPAPNESLVGKVVDEVEKGYYLNDKIIRFAKVVVGK